LCFTFGLRWVFMDDCYRDRKLSRCLLCVFVRRFTGIQVPCALQLQECAASAIGATLAQ
jgi:hypothetical protein